MLTNEQKDGLGVALTEATLLGAEVDTTRCLAAATFALLTLPESGPVPEDRRLQFRFEGVGRVAASLRLGHWDDAAAAVQVFPVDQLLASLRASGAALSTVGTSSTGRLTLRDGKVD